LQKDGFLGARVVKSEMSTEYIDEDNISFLRAAEASLLIRQHKDLLLWLQGGVQMFLPHEVLIAAWGDFSSREITFDVMSTLPGIRTESFYELGKKRPGSIASCAMTTGNNSSGTCGVIPFVKEMRERWRTFGQSPCVSDWSSRGYSASLACTSCNHDLVSVMGGVKSALVHGYADQRGNLECIYVFLSSADLSEHQYSRAARFFLPYIDHGLRRVELLPLQVSSRELTVLPPDSSPDDSGLSAREQEIMDWVRIGKTNYEIGMILNISAFTVKNHLQRIFKKLDVSNRAQAVSKMKLVSR
jgi:transcriptional regulator EpsA